MLQRKVSQRWKDILNFDSFFLTFAFTFNTISIKCTAVSHSMAFPHIWIFSPLAIHRWPMKRSINTSQREKLRWVLNAIRWRPIYFHRRARSTITQLAVALTPVCSDSKLMMCIYIIWIDEIMQFISQHLKFKLTWINGLKVLQKGELSVCIHYGSNKVCTVQHVINICFNFIQALS